jgi:hypothetical protein
MKKVIFLMMALMTCFASSIQSQSTVYQKHENLINYMGYPQYAGWSVSLHYDVNDKGEVISDSTFYVFATSAEYTQITETFTLLRTNNLDDVKQFFLDLNNAITNMPLKSSTNLDKYGIRLYKTTSKAITITSLTTGRDDSWTYYSVLVWKQVDKGLKKIR